MLDMLSGATIGELFRELAQVERKIQDCDPLFVSSVVMLHSVPS